MRNYLLRNSKMLKSPPAMRNLDLIKKHHPDWYTPWTSSPPCPYPTAPPKPPSVPHAAPGILGPRPPQAYSASENSFTPTDLEQAFHTMTLTPPDQNWYMDSGATSHMTNTSGNLSSYDNKSIFRNIVVGNGAQIPIQGTGNQTLPKPYPPLHLTNVLHVPHLIKNLLSVRRLTTDNNITIEFDPYGFDVKDFRTRTPLLRCNSLGDLYPLTFPQKNHVTSPSVFAAITQDLWHHRLGHPGANILSILHKNLSIPRTVNTNSVCQSCIFGKHTKLPFVTSTSITCSPFDIIHSDLWTSPVLSSGGHRFYLLFLDDYTNFLWTYPIAHKSQVFPTFVKFYNLIKTQFNTNIKSLQCDNGKEYDNTLFKQFCDSHGMVLRFSCPYTSAQNANFCLSQLQLFFSTTVTLLMITYAFLDVCVTHYYPQQQSTNFNHALTPAFFLAISATIVVLNVTISPLGKSSYPAMSSLMKPLSLLETSTLLLPNMIYSPLILIPFCGSLLTTHHQPHQ
ncbi:hypothetical protein E3N88_41025 [Mikania micrantha]|uniref:Integrase catalytic domain-containing protein n=1 Tax=Mikania micrantha TaxID=192012 RepID=A0A5N6LRM2_9ASTR|nr:hypothetical protein E3N88_41025 [Mikania micrantha]